jgi:hypothetical protein
MGQLSALVSMFEKSQGARHQSGRPGARTSAHPPAIPGFARGTAGVMGSKLLQTRNSDAGQDKELQKLQDPIFQAYMAQMNPATPMLDHLRGGR